MQSFPSHAQVVIVGGGIIGCSVAYHLTHLGWTDVVLLERGQLTCGTTWHSGAVIGQLRPSYNMTRLAQYTGELLARLEAETGQATGYKRNGALVVTASKERFTELRRSASMGRCFGLEVETLSPREAREIWPLLNIDDLIGGVYLPTEGQTNPTDSTQALARGARIRGARIFENTTVTGIDEDRGRVSAVRTSNGDIGCEVVVNCTGLWARELGLAAGVRIPLQAVEHMYVVTEPVAELTPDLPSLRDHNQCIYFRVDARQMLVGINEPNAKVWGLDGIPDDFAFGELPEDWDHFGPYLENALHRVPALANAGIKLFLSGPESMTPDTRYLLGETPGLANHYVAAGFSGVGVGSSGGAGKALAEWIVDGRPSMDLWDVDVRRMMPFQTNQQYLAERVQESNGLLYDMHWPFRQHESARNVRRSMLHDELRTRGACFAEVAGWERPGWYAPPATAPRYEYSYGRQNWFEPSALEHRSVRERVGLLDISSDVKLQVQGENAASVLDRLCTSQVQAPGRFWRSLWLNEAGGTEALVRVVRETDESFLVLSEPETAVLVHDWLRANLPLNGVMVHDLSSVLAQLALAGPSAPALLACLLGPSYPLPRIGESQPVEIGYGEARLSRLSDVGEPSYQLLIPAEMAPGIYRAILTKGEQFALQHVGWHAWRSLCMEKSVRFWGDVVGAGDSPVDAGLTSLVDNRKDCFVGADALDRQSRRGPDAKLLSFALDDPQPQLYSNEPVLIEGGIVGYLLTGMYGHSVGRAIGMGYVATEHLRDSAIDDIRFQIEIAGERFTASATDACFYDADNHREHGGIPSGES